MTRTLTRPVRSRARAAVVAALLGALSCGRVLAADPAIAVVVAAGSAIAIRDRVQLANVFRRKLRVDASGESIVAVNLALSDPVRTAFSRAVFGVDPDMMENYWNEQYFRGISPPPVVASSEAMLRFVEATRGAVGYVPSCEVDSRVVVIMTLPIDWSRDRWAARCPD